MKAFFKISIILSLLLCNFFFSTQINADDKSTIRIGLSAIPPMNFSPFRNTGLPYVYTWSSVFEGLISSEDIMKTVGLTCLLGK